MIIKEIEFTSNLNDTLPGRLYLAEGGTEKGVIFCHGLFSTKDGYKITRLANAITDAGCDLLTFDFSFVKNSFEKIRGISLLQEVEELKAAVRYFRGFGIRDLHLVGSSMGAAVSLLYCGLHDDSIRSIVTIAAPFKLDDIVAHNAETQTVSSLDPDDPVFIDGIEIGASFFQELLEVDMAQAVRNISCPVLIIHGMKDNIVHCSNAGQLNESLQGKASVVIIDDGDHNLTRESDLALLGNAITCWLGES